MIGRNANDLGRGLKWRDLWQFRKGRGLAWKSLGLKDMR